MEPKIRFKGFSGIWNCLDLISTFDYIPNNTFSRKDLSINGTVKNIHYGDILVKFDEILNISEVQLPAISYISSTSRPLQNGDIVMADTAEDETVGKAVEIVDIQDNLVEAGLHTYALRPNTSFARGFLGYYINSPAFHDQLLPLIQGTKVCSISKKALSFLSLFVPSKNAEQQAIASYFQAIDAQISFSKSRLASLKQIKVASLQSMFPQEGETVPKVRFKGFEGEWNSLDLISTFDYIPNNTFSRKDLSINGVVKNIHYGDILVKFDEILNISEVQLPAITCISSTCRPLQNGDIIMADTAEDETVGKAVEIEGIQDELVEAGLHTYALRPNISFASGFLGYYINSPSFHDQLLPLIQGTKVCSVSKKAISSLSLCVPSNNAEQQAIASFFSTLDRKISLETARLEKLKQIKAACLDKMFV